MDRGAKSKQEFLALKRASKGNVQKMGHHDMLGKVKHSAHTAKVTEAISKKKKRIQQRKKADVLPLLSQTTSFDVLYTGVAVYACVHAGGKQMDQACATL